MKKKMIWFCAAILVLMMAGSVNASYIATTPGNDKDKDDVVDKLLIDNNFEISLGDLELLGKSDEGNDFVITFAPGSGNTSGVWALSDGSTIDVNDIGFISVKAGPNFSVFRADDFNWDTEKLGNKELSHISFWKAPGYEGPGGNGGSAAIPEPATIALLCAGIGVLGFNRIRKKFAKE
jgi:hypothetical protein